jgi:RNA polymerase sigma factor (sigma-70 family)
MGGYRTRVDDRTLVEAMTRRDPTGLEGAYRRYVDALYAYCRALLRDADAAADVVHDTFLIASQRAGDLREPDRLRSWLYAIARHECLRVLRTRRRSASLDEAAEPVAEPVDPTAAVHADQVRDLVRAAAAGLSAGDREVIELSVRHGLSAAEVGAVLGVAANHAHARMSRARQQLLGCLGALVVARGGAENCAGLAEVLRGWDGSLTALVRKRINRHVDGCATCSARQSDELQPAKLLSVYAGLPFLADARLTDRLDAAGQRASGRAGDGTVPAIRLGPDGFPRRPRSGRSAAAAAAAVAVLLILGASTVIFARGPATEPALAAPTGPGGSAAAGPGPGDGGLQAGGGGSPTSTPSPTPGPSDPPTTGPPDGPPDGPPTTTRPPTSTTATLVIVSFFAYSDAELTCAGSTGATMTVDVTANKPLFRAMLYWKFPDVARKFGAMTRSGTTATRTVTTITKPTVTWWVSLTATDGSRFTSSKVTEDNPC